MTMSRRRFLETSAVLAGAAASTNASGAATRTAEPTLFELRNYGCRPGQRDELIRQFESIFLDAYERTGTRAIATFRDLDNAARWVWMRAFQNPEQRGQALQAFYASTDWKTNARAANATIADIAPALLLSRVALHSAKANTGRQASGVVYLVTIYPLKTVSANTFAPQFLNVAIPRLAALGADLQQVFVTDGGQNHFPRQPVRAEPTFVTFQRFASSAALAAFEAKVAKNGAWADLVGAYVAPHLNSPRELLRLAPTLRSTIK